MNGYHRGEVGARHALRWGVPSLVPGHAVGRVRGHAVDPRRHPCRDVRSVNISTLIFLYDEYRGTSRIGKCTLLETYRRPVPRVLGGS